MVCPFSVGAGSEGEGEGCEVFLMRMWRVEMRRLDTRVLVRRGNMASWTSSCVRVSSIVLFFFAVVRCVFWCVGAVVVLWCRWDGESKMDG
jgi:hypothetical protein